MKQLFDNYNGTAIYSYTLSSKNLEVEIVEYGARINALRFNGVNVALGYKSVWGSKESACYIGATVGRCANRIENARFVLNGKEYQVSNNENKNHLHGGIEGFDQKIFNVDYFDDQKIVLSYESKDGEEGYPGNLKLTVTYTIKDNDLIIDYDAISDKDTLFNPTCHTYFNFNGEEVCDCRDNEVYINATSYTVSNDKLIPTGEVQSVISTPLDFTKLKPLIKDIDEPMLIETKGYDHNFILDGEYAASVRSTLTNISMDLYTDLPCLQLYTGGFLQAKEGKTRAYDAFDGFCLEPQYAPNAINIESFKKPIIKAGEKVHHYIKYSFKTNN